MLGKRLKEVERTARGLAAREQQAASQEASARARTSAVAQREAVLEAADAQLGSTQARLAQQVSSVARFTCVVYRLSHGASVDVPEIWWYVS